ncbi:DUF1963 domain-containing protein [Kitasatospora phosalacinea]|uniref:DUF1963 domain-containing protein n=1 Tax=Kitasatospora phosalacinea TaxID=2065 RepID=UPI000526A00F|nr:DUF1963 domain-containing protein [Kitasatospora phosalacinea]
MEFHDPADLPRICAERLGARAGARFAAMARRGFRLEPATDDAPPTGRCRLGGPALLDPETPWPSLGGVPLSLLAVLDTDALRPWLGDELPTRPGLLNFFQLDPDIPYEEYRQLDTTDPEMYRVVPADPDRAVETAAPAPARRYPARPVRAVGSVMLPDSWDVADDDLEYDPDRHWGAASLVLDAMEGFDGNTAGRHCAFGWPDTSYGTSVTDRDADGPVVHLLQLAADDELGWAWGDAGTLYFTIPAKAFAAGDYGPAGAVGLCC